MATDNQFLRIKKLTGKSIISAAMKHNHREIQAEQGADSHIDATRTHLNIILAGAVTAGGVSSHAERLMLEAGVGKLRRDAVRGLELIISLPPASTVNQSAFFSDALAWVQGFYGLPVLSAVIHNDEATPHVHIIMLPLIDGRMKGSDLVGNRARLQALQTGFYEQVGRMYGLTRPKPPQRISAATRLKSASLIVSALQSDPDLLVSPGIESALLATIGRDPEPLLSALGLSVPHPPKSTKSFVQIMTKPCKPEKPIGFASSSKPIGFGDYVTKKEQTLSCVGFADPKPPIPLPERSEAPFLAAQPPDPVDDYQRIRDDEQEAGQWDSDTGDFIQSRPLKQSRTILHRRSA
jgi:hypothetical protein